MSPKTTKTSAYILVLHVMIILFSLTTIGTPASHPLVVRKRRKVFRKRRKLKEKKGNWKDRGSLKNGNGVPGTLAETIAPRIRTETNAYENESEGVTLFDSKFLAMISSTTQLDKYFADP
jgi:hypothetical protein